MDLIHKTAKYVDYEIAEIKAFVHEEISLFFEEISLYLASMYMLV